MKKASKILSWILLLCLILTTLAACGEGGGQDTTKDTDNGGDTVDIQAVDYAVSVPLDLSTDTLKAEVDVKLYIDGDTTHFYIDDGAFENGVLKARFLAVNTPESTGKIEEYGKRAAAFTKEKLSGATSIILESDDGNWNADSTGDRYLVWVWYKPAGSNEYRNLNIELLQNGLAIASSSANNRYGDICMKAIAQAKAQKLSVHSGQKDPDFYYGEAVELTLKELRTNIQAYNGVKVAFNGIITLNDENSVYIEAYDPETDMYHGISIYYGFNLSGAGLGILAVGNEARIVGTVSYYDAGGTYQVSGLSYRQMKPNDPNNIQKISEGNPAAYALTDPATFANGKVEVTLDDEVKTFDYAELAMGTTISMNNLVVTGARLTDDESSDSYGAMTLFCEADGVTIDVRTNVMYDENGDRITPDAYIGKTVDVRGIVDYFRGKHQIKVFLPEDITVHQ